MKALTIPQPRASRIASGEQWVENSHWPTDHRGRLAIHAGEEMQYLDKAELRAYPTGCVIAVVQLVACVDLYRVKRHDFFSLEHLRLNGIDPEDFLAHEYVDGPWCWVLRDVQPYRQPISCRGAQGLWDWEEPELVEYED